MAESLSESSTPRGGDAHRRAPDPAGTRPKVDLLTGRPDPDQVPVPAAVGGESDGDPRAVGADEVATAPAFGSTIGRTFGPTPEPEPLKGRAQPPSAGLAEPVAALAPAGGTGARSAGDDVIGSSSPVQSQHGPRFQFLIGALIALAISALAITVLTLRSGRDSTPADWASWHPTATGFAAAAQISAHVGPEYRLASNAQMVAVQSGPLALDGVPLTLVRRSSASANADIVALAGNAVLYKMCGLGPSCSIVGTPSAERLTLVRREALELALDTFEYVANANQVVVFLPPIVTAATTGAKKTTTGATDALFFQASDFRSELDRPLSTTLTARPPTIGTVDKATDTPVVKALTTPSFYSFSIVSQAADATVFLVLQPFAVS
ncbi:MAG TPA: hypothetical protein VIJ51_19675 [Solirubrobacteraceae bacterium]